MMSIKLPTVDAKIGLLLTCLLMASVIAVDQNLFSGIITSKDLWVQTISLLFTVKITIVIPIIEIYLKFVFIQAIIGLFQIYGVIDSYHSLFKFTGAFHNPGSLSGYLVSGFPLALTLYFTTKNKALKAVNNNSGSSTATTNN